MKKSSALAAAGLWYDGNTLFSLELKDWKNIVYFFSIRITLPRHMIARESRKQIKTKNKPLLQRYFAPDLYLTSLWKKNDFFIPFGYVKNRVWNIL